SFRSGLLLLFGLPLLAAAATLHAILLETVVWTVALAAGGALLAVVGLLGLRAELAALARRRRGEIALATLGIVGVLVALAYFSVRYPFRLDLTPEGVDSLSAPTATMLKRLDKPIHHLFFHSLSYHHPPH